MNLIPLAHGLGGRSDLPVPLWIAVYGAVAALLVSFAALTFFWKKPKFTGAGGRPIPDAVGGVLSSPSWGIFLRLVGFFAFLWFLAAAWFGTNDPGTNPAPYWLYVWFWVGLLPVSMLFGPVVKAMSPLRAISGLISMAMRGSERPLPQRWGMWPAAIGLFVFVWIELVSPDASLPRVVALFATSYALIHIVAGVIYGQDWFEQGEAFEVYSTLVGRLSPLARTDYGTWVVRNPMHGLALAPPVTGLVAVVSVLLGSTAFDGLTRTPFWIDYSNSVAAGAPYLLAGTLGLLGCIAVVAGVYWGAIQMTRSWLPDRTTLLADFAPSLLPIAIGYTIAHYFSFAIFDGQMGWILASDPFGLGWDLFGTEGARINYTLVSTEWIALVQVGAIAIGHIAGVVLAHDRAISLFRRRHHLSAQYPLLCAMVAFTMSGIALVVGSEKSFWLLVTVAVFIPMAALFVWISAPVESAEPVAD